MITYVATHNAGKLREFRQIFEASAWDIRHHDAYADVEETGSTYAANAALKARALYARLVATGERAAVLADDSGLEIRALGGRPGVLSARYGGATATWPQRRAGLLAELAAAGGHDRSAAFVCALHYIGPDGDDVAIEERVAGRIVDAERGDDGFSYDSLFEYPPLGRTFAEISEHEKNQISHRGRAVRRLRAALDT